MKKILKVAGYARVSTDEQKKFGYSINAQIDEITQWCAENGHELMEMYVDDGYSASTMDRPKLQALLHHLNRYDAVAFTRLDRFSRSVLEANKMLALLQQNNVAMIAICEDDINTTTANGLFMFNLKVNLAEHELKKGSERIKAVFDYKIAQGQPITGSVPFGYKIASECGVKKVVKDSSTSHIVDAIFAHFLRFQSIHQTVSHINDTYGLSRHYNSYSKMLRNEFYAGSYRGNENYAEPYISMETFNAVQNALKSNLRAGTNRQVYLFSGLIKCPKCRHILTGLSHINKGNGTRYYFYRCNYNYAHHVCDCKRHFSEIKIEQYLLDNISRLAGEHMVNIRNVKNSSVENTKREIERLKTEMENLNYIFFKKRMSVSTYDSMYAELEQKISSLSQECPSDAKNAAIRAVLDSGWVNIYQNMKRENKRVLWRNIIKEINVDLDYKIKIIFK